LVLFVGVVRWRCSLALFVAVVAFAIVCDGTFAVLFVLVRCPSTATTTLQRLAMVRCSSSSSSDGKMTSHVRVLVLPTTEHADDQTPSYLVAAEHRRRRISTAGGPTTPPSWVVVVGSSSSRAAADGTAIPNMVVVVRPVFFRRPQQCGGGGRSSGPPHRRGATAAAAGRRPASSLPARGAALLKELAWPSLTVPRRKGGRPASGPFCCSPIRLLESMLGS
jgi:hypothetical protein